MTSRASVRATVAAGALALVAASALSLAPAASAAPTAPAAKPLQILYSTTGSTTLSNPNSQATITFAPATLQSFVTFQPDNTATVKAYLPLAPVTASFKAYGFLPSRGTVVFTQVGAATGTLGEYDPETGFPLSVTARYVVTLRDVVIGGTRANVGTNCQTVRPLTVTITADQGFDLSTGSLNGTYDLSPFNNCGQASTIINDTVPGTGNFLHLDIGFAGGAKQAAAAQAGAPAAG